MRVIVTRPERDAPEWVQGLASAGLDVAQLPLIDIRAMTDVAALHSAWQNLHSYGAVMFVSGNAVEHFFLSKPTLAPVAIDFNATKTRVWATGPGTARALLEAGVDAGLLDAPPIDAGQFDSEALWSVVHGSVNPLAQVPTLVLDDGSILTESAAIMLWLCERVPGMVPTDATTRAQFYRWMIFVPANIYPMISLRDFPARWVEGEDAQKAFREKTTDRLKVLWMQLESALQPAPYALGGKMSALDIYLAMVSRWAPGRKWLAEHCPKLAAAVILTEQHPVVAKVWEKNFGK